MQDSLFDFPQMEINKPIRLITLFSGIGSDEFGCEFKGNGKTFYSGTSKRVMGKNKTENLQTD